MCLFDVDSKQILSFVLMYIFSNSSEGVHELKQLIEDDSDFDVEPELPPLKQLFTDDTVKKLKPKEKKRQEVING